jgi:phospholipase C
LLAEIYDTLISNPARWNNAALIVTYDEHGGFFDHVAPLPIPDTAGGQAFSTTGVRVPAFVVSPHVAPGVPFRGKLDHTSILRLLAERFDGGAPYSAAVAARQQSLDPLSAVFVDPAPAAPTPPAPSLGPPVAATAPPSEPQLAAQRSSGASANATAFASVAAKVAQDHPDLLQGEAWAPLTRYLAGRA